MIGWTARRWIVPGLALVAGWGMAGTALAAGGDQLFAQQPDHPLIESSQRVSDGRKLQHDADESLRRADASAGAEVTGTVAAAKDGEGSARRVAAGQESSERVQSER
jgi:hypothetical protein